MSPKVLADHSDWFVLNKPAFYHTSAHPHPIEANIESWVLENFPKQKTLPEAGIIHRLDYLTSGCLLVAKNEQAFTKYRDLIKSDGELKKTYLAITNHAIKPGSFELYFASRYKRSKQVTVAKKGEDNERGKCKWKLHKKLKNHSMIEVELVGPGKRHQIRAGLAALGFPLLGDEIYEGEKWDGLGLHAWKLQIGENSVEAPLPESWLSLD